MPGRWYTMPYNRYQSDETDWWISSVPDNPAFAAAKVTCRRVDGDFRIGLLIEKGVAPHLKSIHMKKNEVMTSRWAWPRALAHLAGAEFDETLRGLAEFGEIELEVHAGMATRDADWRSVRYTWDLAQFNRMGPAEAHLGHLPMRLVLTDLPDVLSAIPNVDWQWIDVFVQLRVDHDPDATTQMETEMVQGVVEPLSTIARRLTGSRG